LRQDTTIPCRGGFLFVRVLLPDEPRLESTLVFLHGNTFPSIADFDLPIVGHSFAAHLAGRGIPVCIFDHRGFGRSSKPPRVADVTVQEKAHDLAAVHAWLGEAHGTRSVHLIGLSTGCHTIAQYLRGVQEQIRSLVFIGPCYLRNRRVRAGIRKLFLARLLNTLRGRKDHPYVSFTRKSLEKRLLRGEDGRIARSRFDAFVEASMASAGAERVVSPVLGFPAEGSPDSAYKMFDARTIHLPTLIIRGERDEYCCPETATELVRDIPSGETEVVTIKDSKHDLHLYDDPVPVFDLIGRFVKTHEEVR
jgi:pimeloyl-ACP methyl ester carboxylesterase